MEVIQRSGWKLLLVRLMIITFNVYNYRPNPSLGIERKQFDTAGFEQYLMPNLQI